MRGRMGGEGDTLVKVGRGPKLTMFYGRSVSGRYGLGAPFCSSFTQQGPDRTQRPSAQPSQSRSQSQLPVKGPLPADKLGGRQVRCGGEVPAFGEALAQVKTPHTARVRAQQWQPAIPTPPPGKEHTRQAHLSSPVFVASPRLSPSLHAVQFFTGSRETCSSSLGASQPAFDRASPRTQHPSQANAQKKGKM